MARTADCTRVVELSRDPFARTTLVRGRIWWTATCDWCGRAARWQYGRRSDDGREGWDTHTWCALDCYRAYHS